MEQLFGAIKTVLDGHETNANSDEAMVFAAWSRCAGELLRVRTKPLEFFEKHLVIAAQDKTWQRHLEELSPQMLVKLNHSLGQGTVKFIEFRINATVVNTARKTMKVAATNDARHTIAPSLAKAAEAISDKDLREQFLTAAASYLAKQAGN